MGVIPVTSSTSLFIMAVVMAALSVAGEARAQGMPAGAGGAESAERRWDASVGTGLFYGRPPKVSANEFDNWYHTGLLGFTVGRYLTPHVKVEGELGMTGEGRRFVQRFIDVPGRGPYPVGSEHLLNMRSVSGALTWQFLENQWVHPFVSAGVSVDLDRTRVHTWPQSYYPGHPFLPGPRIPSAEQIEDVGTTARVRGLIGAGAKLYVTPRAFFRTEARVGVGAERSGHVAFRVGFGFDF